MSPPFTASLSSAPSISQLDQPEQQSSHQPREPSEHQQEHKPKQVDQEQEEKEQEQEIPTDITIKTNVDPHDETTTTTTIVHLPFQIAQQCPPPKVISWMKSHRAARPKQLAAQHAAQQHHHHHHHNSRHRTPIGLQRLVPFFTGRRRGAVERTTTAKGNRAVTVFSIQVTVLGKVLVPPTPSTSAVDASTSSTSGQEGKSNIEAEHLAPTKTIPAQLNRSETTSYVIHRTFEDFQRLSENVLRLQHAIKSHTSSWHQRQSHPLQDEDEDLHKVTTLHRHHERSTGGSSLSGSIPVSHPVTIQAPSSSHDGPVLTALKVHHPHPSLYQALLRRFSFSTAKANQRAFDASSTTHGFNEEGAFERVLELNQYLQDVWYWLLPENIHPELDLSLVHDIMHWLKPSASLQDGRQMRDRQEKQEKQPLSQTSIMRKYQGTPKTVTMQTDSAASTIASGQVNGVRTATSMGTEGASPSVTSLPSSFSSSTSPSSPPSSSSSISGSSPVSSMSVSSSTVSQLHDEDDMGGEYTGGISPVPPTTPKRMTQQLANVRETSPRPLNRLPSVSKRRLRQEGGGDRSVSETEKVKRRMSFGHVFQSMSLNSSSTPHRHHPHRHSHLEAAADQGKKLVSASVPTSPTHRATFSEEIYLWSTVTTKNLPKHSTMTSSPHISTTTSVSSSSQ